MAAARACDQTAKTAMSNCQDQITSAVMECKQLLAEASKTGVAQNELKIRKANYISCRNRAKSEGHSCLQKVDKALGECKSKEEVAVNSEQEAVVKKEGAQAEKIEAGVEKQFAAAKKADAIDLKQQGQQLVAEGQAKLSTDPVAAGEKIAGGQNYKTIGQQKEFQADTMNSNAVAKENEAINKEQKADQQMNEASLAVSIIASNIAALVDMRAKAKSQLDQLDEGMSTAVDQVDEINKASGGDLSDSQEIARKPKGESPAKAPQNPGSNKGQGGNPPKSDGAPSSQAKKNDEGQGGGPGGGPGGSPSSSPSSSPLKVSEGPKDCSNPSVAASNPVCACRLNPSDSRCNSILAADRERREGPAKKPKVIDGEEGGGGGSSFNGTGPQSAAQKAAISKHGQLEQNGGGGSGKGVGSGMGGSAASSSKNDSKVNPRDQKPAAGQGGRSYGGGGGGGSGSSGYQAGAPNRKIPNTFAASGNSMGRNPASVTRAPTAAELKALAQNQFNALRRGPSGSGSMIGVDGISGPHTDQFKKIRVRYADAFGL